MVLETIAINVALLPDPVMEERARAMNLRLLQNYPQGFPLDDSHVPHITLCQAFVRARDLSAIWQAIKGLNVGGSLRAEAFDFYPKGELGTSGFDVSLPAWLKDAHPLALKAVKPYARGDGDACAFVTTADEPQIGDSTLSYVRRFFEAHAGDHYRPHVTLGSAHADFLETLRQEAFRPFEFSVRALAMYQLGNHGTCRKLLFRQPTEDSSM